MTQAICSKLPVMVTQELCIRVLFLSFALSSVNGFCTAYHPMPGGSFSFPQKQCLTQKFLNNAYASGRLGQQNLTLATMKPVFIQDSEFVLPSFDIGVLASVESGEAEMVLAFIIGTLVRQIFGFEFKIVCARDSNIMYRFIAEHCQNPYDQSAGCLEQVLVPPIAATFSYREPKSQAFSFESEHNLFDFAKWPMGYSSLHGLWLSKEISQQAWEQSMISLEHLASYARYPNVNRYFDSYLQITSDMAWFSNGVMKPLCEPGDSSHSQINQTGSSCEQGWFFASACKDDKESCVPVVLAEFDLDGLAWMQAAETYGYPFAITWIGARHSLEYGIRGNGRLLFECSASIAMCHEKPLAKLLIDPSSVSSMQSADLAIHRLIDNALLHVESRFLNFISTIHFTNDDVNAIMQYYTQRIDSNKDFVNETVIQDVACKWLTDEIEVISSSTGQSVGSNLERWSLWVPGACPPGFRYNRESRSCLGCPPGHSYNNFSDYCKPCDIGTYSQTYGAAECVACPFGKWAVTTSSLGCESCPPGKFQDGIVQGCTDCSPGRFSEREKRSACERCVRGRYADNTGYSACTSCKHTFTTKHMASTTRAECCCPPHFFYPCFALPQGGGCSSLSETLTECRSCPGGFTCPGYIWNNSHVQPDVEYGHYARQTAPYDALKCTPEDICPGGALEKCKKGTLLSGLACQECPNNFAKKGGICQECTSTSNFAAIGVYPLIFIGSATLYYCLNIRSSSKATTMLASGISFGMLLGVLQNHGVFLMLSIPWPDPLYGFMQISKILELDLDMMNAGCIYGNDAVLEYVNRVSVFFKVPISLFIGYFLSQLIFPHILSLNWMAWSVPKLINTLGGFLQVSFTTMCAVAMKSLTCITHPSGESSLKEYPNVMCGSTEHSEIMVPGTILIITSTLYFCVTLWVCYVTPAKAAAGKVDFLLSVRFLLFRFRVQVHWWSCLVMGRAILIALTPLVVERPPQGQMLMIVGIFAVTGPTQINRWPWKVPMMNLVDATITILMVCLIISGSAFMEKVDEKDRDVFNIVMTVSLLALYALVCSVFLMSVLSLYLTDKAGLLNEPFLLRQVPNITLMSSGVHSLGVALIATMQSDVQHLLKELPMYDITLLEMFLEIMDQSGIAFGITDSFSMKRSFIKFAYQELSKLPATAFGFLMKDQNERDGSELSFSSKGSEYDFSEPWNPTGKGMRRVSLSGTALVNALESGLEEDNASYGSRHVSAEAGNPKKEEGMTPVSLARTATASAPLAPDELGLEEDNASNGSGYDSAEPWNPKEGRVMKHVSLTRAAIAKDYLAPAELDLEWARATRL